MRGLFSCASYFFKLGPRHFIRERIKLPIVKFIYDTIELYKRRTKAGVNSVKEVLFKGTFVALITALLVWLSVFMYVAFYYAYVPSILHERPVFLRFKSCDKWDVHRSLCSFPSANVQLTKGQQILMAGQPYKMYLELEMPESPVNRELGMFMVCADFHSHNGEIVTSSCRSTMLPYRSFLIDLMYKIVYSPFFIFWGAEEKQTIRVEMFSDYSEEALQPITQLYIEVQSRHIEIYTAKFTISANFAGLRYIMFHWPILSAAIGITSNLFFIAVISMLSWYQILNSDEYQNFVKNQTRESKDFLDVMYVIGSIFTRKLWGVKKEHCTLIDDHEKAFECQRKCTKCNKFVCSKHFKRNCKDCKTNGYV